MSKHISFLAIAQTLLVSASQALAAAPDAYGAAQPVKEEPSGSAMLVSLFPFLLIFVIFYFLIIAPQRKQQKETTKMLAALKKGDRVVSSGGMHGTITDFKEVEKIVVMEVAPNVRVSVNRSAVASVKREAQPQITAK